jgi:hypothetical protein
MLARNGCKKKRVNSEVLKESLNMLGITLKCFVDHIPLMVLTFYSNGAIAALAGSQFDSSSPPFQLSLGARFAFVSF